MPENYWGQHKSVCKSKYADPKWKPDPLTTLQESYKDKMSEVDLYMRLTNIFLCGNIPAFDIINIDYNEGKIHLLNRNHMIFCLLQVGT